jgi:hypothetical protein
MVMVPDWEWQSWWVAAWIAGLILGQQTKKRPAGTGLAGRLGFQQSLAHGLSRRLRRRVSVCRLWVLLRSERHWSAAELRLKRRSAERFGKPWSGR